MSWYLDNTKLNHADLSGSVPETGICGDDSGAPYYGYPASFWQYNSETQKLQYPINTEALNISGLVPPYPASFWYLDVDNRLNMALLPEGPAEGAFIGCTMLEYVSIPESVQYIGEYAFKNTALTRVRLSRTCTYYPTSFPAGCEIWFYDEEPNAEESYTKADTDDLLNAKQDKLSADNRLGGNIVNLTGYTAEASPTTWTVPAATDTLNEAFKKLDNNTRLNQADISALTSVIADLQARVTALES